LHYGEQLQAPGHPGAGDDRDVFGSGHAAWDHCNLSQPGRSTITRELNGNGWRRPTIVPRPGKKLVAGGYNCERAEHRARRQSSIPRVARKLVPGTPLWRLVVEHLRRGLSPAQIESTLARMPEPIQLSRETIYTALYAMPKGSFAPACWP